MKKSVPVRMDPELHERVMRMIYWTPGISFNSLVNLMLETYMDREERERGAPFEDRNINR